MGTVDEKTLLQIVKSRTRVKKARKKEGTDKTYTLTVKAKHLPEGTTKDDLVAAVIVNAQKKEKEQEEKKEKASFNPKRFLALALAGVTLLSVLAARGCDKKGYIDTQTIEQVVIYEPENPQKNMVAVVNARGQEGMTANALEGQDVMEGEHYNADQHFEDEERASMGQEDFEQMEQQLEENMEILVSPNATQEQKVAAAKQVLSINKKIQSIYMGNLGFVEEKAADFEESARAFEDSHTEEEIKIIRATVDEYRESIGLTTSNIVTLTKIVELGNDGYSLDISGEENQRGDYTISGEAVREYIEKGDYLEAQKKYKNFSEYVMGREQMERGED